MSTRRNYSRRDFLKAALGTGAAALAAACAPSSPPAPAPPAPAGAAAPAGAQAPAATKAPAPAAAPAKAGRPNVTVALSATLEPMDGTKISSSISGGVLKNAVQGLTGLAADGSIVPALAESWEVSQDKLTWTFKLRKNVVFTDGTPFDAGVVKANVDRWLDKNVVVSARRNLGPLTGAEVVDPYTVRMKTSSPYVVLTSSLAHPVACIHSPKEIQARGEQLGAQPVAGTGPFKIIELTPGRRVVMVRNDQYWGPKAKTERLTANVTPDDNSRLAMLQTGEVDVAVNIPYQLIDVIRADSRLALTTTPSWSIYTLFVNHTKPIYRDVKVRQGLSLAVDRASIVKNLFKSEAIIPESTLPKGVYGWSPVFKAEYNPDRAKQILAEAGWKPNSAGVLSKDGQEFTANLVTSVGSQPMDRDLGQVLAEQLKVIGVKTNLLVPGDYTVVKKVTQTDADAKEKNELVLNSFGAMAGDPDIVLNYYDSSQCIPAGINVGCYSNPKYDELNKKSQGTFDVNERAKVIKDQTELASNDYATVLIVQTKLLVATRADVKGLTVLGNQHFFYDEVEAGK